MLQGDGDTIDNMASPQKMAVPGCWKGSVGGGWAALSRPHRESGRNWIGPALQSQHISSQCQPGPEEGTSRMIPAGGCRSKWNPKIAIWKWDGLTCPRCLERSEMKARSGYSTQQGEGTTQLVGHRSRLLLRTWAEGSAI